MDKERVCSGSDDDAAGESKGTIIRVRGVYFSSGGQAAVVKAFLCWVH